MAKYTELSEENKKLFSEVLNETSIPQHVIIETLGYDKAKKVCDLKKASDIMETLTDGVNFVMIINEDIFDQLSDDHQRIAIHDEIAGVVYDSEKDKIIVNKPDICTHSGILAKYGSDEVLTIKESIKSLYDAKKQREDEEKAARSEKRGKRKVFDN